jgi:SAM-dependent methyltransferase
MRVHPVQAGLGDRRRRLLAGATGAVLDVGGYAFNGPDYPPGVEVHDVLPSEVSGLPDESFDTVVCTFVLCSVDDPRALLASIGDVLASDGRLLFLEHVRGGGLRGLAQRAAAPAWTRVFDGCHPDRDTVGAVRTAGFLITDLDRFPMRFAAPMIVPAVAGAAKRARG